MNRIPVIPPLPGVPDQLTQVLNARFRQVQTGQEQVAAAVQQQQTTTASAGPAGPPGPAGAPGAGAAPTPPSFAAVSCTATPWYARDGHNFDVGFVCGFTPPTSAGPYNVIVTATSPSGAFTAQLNVIQYGWFTVGTPYSFTSDTISTLVAGNWTVQFIPINADNVTGAGQSVIVAVAANLITAVTGSEGSQFIEPGGGAKTHVVITPTITSSNAPGLSTMQPQTVSFYFSADNGVTWFGLGWIDVTASGQAETFELWRPTDAAKTQCKVAVAIGAWDYPPNTFQSPGPVGGILNANLPAGNVQSSVFTVAQVGSPLVSDCTGGFVNTLTGPTYNQVVLQTDGQGAVYWGLPNGLGWVNPAWTTDPNFFYAVLTAQCVDSTGTPAPTADLGGVESEVERFDQPGTVTCFIVDDWPFNPVGSTYVYMRFRVYVVSRSAVNGFKDATYSTLQTTVWSGADHRDIDFGTPPASNLTPAPAPTAPSFAGLVGGQVLGVGGCTAQASPFYVRDGHDYNVGCNAGFTAPANPGGGYYDVQVFLYTAGGSGKTLASVMRGPFTPSTSYTFAIAAGPPLVAGTWSLEYVPVNTDNKASASIVVNFTVAANLITAVTGSEGSQFIEPGGGAKTHVVITPTITSSNAPGLSSSAPQTISFYFSADNGTTWYGLGWVDVTASGQVVSIELWRPTDASKTQCRVACAIGAWDFPVGTFQSPGPSGPIAAANLPSGTVQSSDFTLAIVGVPAANDCTGGFVNTLTGPTYNQVVLQTTGQGVTYWGLPNGLGWVNPAVTFDPNFFYAVLTAQCVNSSGTPAPTADLGGVESEVQRFDQPGTVTCFIVDDWEFNPVGSPYIYMRFRVYVVSRSAVNGFKDATYSTLQTSVWGGFSFRDIEFGTPPSSGLPAGPNPASPNFLSATASYSLSQVAGAPVFTISGNLGMPSTDPNYAQLCGYNVYLHLNSGWTFTGTRPAGGWPLTGGLYAYTGPPLPQDVIARTYGLEFRPYNLDGVETSPGVFPSGGLAVPAAAGNFIPPPGAVSVTGVTVSENTSLRVRLPDFTTQGTLHVAITLAANYGTQQVTAWYSADGGSNFLWTNWYPITGTSGSFDLYKVVPISSQSVVIAIVPGSIPGNPGATITAAALLSAYSNRVLSSTLTFVGQSSSSPSTTAVSSATLGTLIALTDPNGAQDWGLSDITIVTANPVVDPYAKFWRLKVFICNSSGTPATGNDGGNVAIVQQGDVDGNTYHVSAVQYWGYPTDPTMVYARFTVEVVSAAGVATVQNCWGGLSYGQLYFGPVPGGAVPAGRLLPTSLGGGLGINPNNNQLQTGTLNASTSLVQDWDFSHDLLIPSSFWLYSGTVTITASGGITGGPYCTLASSFGYIQQQFPIAPSQPLYIQVAARGHGSGTLTVVLQFYTIGLSFISSAPVGTVTGGSSWVGNAIAGTVAGSSVPSNAAFARITLQTDSSGSTWDVTSIIVRQVMQQNVGSQTNSAAPTTTSGDSSAIQTYTGADLSSSVYGKAVWQLTGSDGVGNIQAQIVGTAVAQLRVSQGSGGTQNAVIIGYGGTTIIVAGTSYTGFSGTLAAAVSAGKSVKNGFIAN